MNGHKPELAIHTRHIVITAHLGASAIYPGVE